MPTPLRYLVYFIAAAIGLAAGRYVIPATRSVLERGNDSSLEEIVRDEFWKGKVEEILSAATKPEQKVARGVAMLDRIKVEEFPSVLRAVQADEPLLAVVAAGWAEADSAGFFKFLAAQGSPGEREMKLAGILITTWAGRDFRAAEAAASRLRTPGVEPDPFKALARAQLRADVRKGWDYLQKQNLTLPDPIMFQELEAVNMTAPRWHGLDVHGRMEWLQSLPPSPWQALALAKLAELWLKQSPASVLRNAQTTGRGLNFVSPAAAAWVHEDPVTAAAFFADESMGQVRALLGLELTKAMAGHDAQGAWDFALTSLSGEPRAQAKQAIVSQFITADPLVVWQWLKDLPEDPWRTQVLAKLHTSWKAKDPAQANEWWMALKPTDQRAIQLLKPKGEQ